MTSPSPASPIEEIATRDADLFCPSCGYNLRGTTSDRCPECGLVLDRPTLGTSLLPWAHRRRIGRVRAYVRTAWMVFRRPTLVGREVAKPQLWADAVAFRRVTVGLLFIPLMTAIGIAVYSEVKSDPVSQLFNLAFTAFDNSSFAIGIGRSGFWMDVTLIAVAAANLWYVGPLLLALLCVAWTGLASYWFHPKYLTLEQQNRAVAISYYSAAPLVGVWVLTAIVLAGLPAMIAGSNRTKETVLPIMGLAFYLVLILMLGGWWIGTLKIFRAATHATGLRLIAAVVGLPLSWLLAVLILLGIVPLLFGYFFLFFSSLG